MSNAAHGHNDHPHAGYGHGHSHHDGYYQHQVRHLHPRSRRAEQSGPLRWTAAVVFTVLAIAVLVAALAVLLVVLVLQPKTPYITVRSARLDGLVYDDQQGSLDAELSFSVVAVSRNARTDVSFSDLELRLAFHGMVIAILRADPFDVPRKGELPLRYVARSSGIPLDDAGRAAMEAALADGVVRFSVAGQARAHWKLAGLDAVRFWSRLRCELRFSWPNGTALDFSCKSKARY